ncbi:MAG: hypothetical protein AABY07_00995 [Nanoarchaeota archaeon]
MNPELKQNWVDALRSNRYEQGNLYLTNRGMFCCLGVLCDQEKTFKEIADWIEENI